MSYATSAALQSAVFAQLSGDAALSALVGGGVYDAVPAGDKPATFVVLGPEQVRDRSDSTGQGAEHRLTISVHSTAAGFQEAKKAAAAVAAALVDAPLVLSVGQLVGIGFLTAKAERTENGAARRIDLVFRARVEE
ncbi:gene transfer agent protein [Defluviimonas sp. 20V17]|uniref:DUF3168 domain-containing protein n=1 Tax=Allgaiera indica TaxID=765699 RepID=A0A1H2V6H5_9RHOB|nr:DUF3168 domain-containing protein [Allgaiera indica]KDB03411.1 gene transfer agent protein [Defluviimonas sp. 20V17]SDW63923.1 Protein of unknown function [Allgaiera indica]